MASFPFSTVAVASCMQRGLTASKQHWGITKPTYLGINKYQDSLLKLLSDRKFDDARKAACKALGKRLVSTVKFPDAMTIDLLTVLKADVKWVARGVASTGHKYRGVELSSGFRVMSANTVALQTKSGDVVFLCKKQFATSDGFDMTEQAHALTNHLLEGRSEKEGFTSVVFPLVKLDDISVSLKKLIDMRLDERGTLADDAGYHISKASKKVSFEMDEVGAKVKAEVKIQLKMRGMLHETPKKRFIIDGPFSVWIVAAASHTFPYFVCNVDDDAMTKS